MKCGAENPPDSVFCGECGIRLDIEDKKVRIKKPIGIIVACVLLSIWGGPNTLGSIVVFPYWYYLSKVPEWLLPHGRTGLLIEISISAYSLIVGVGSLIVTYGLWKKRYWAKKWSYGIGFAIIGQIVISGLRYRAFDIGSAVVIFLAVVFMIYIAMGAEKYFSFPS